MSQPWQPQPQPGGGGQPPQPGYGYPQQQPPQQPGYGYPPPQPGAGVPPQPYPQPQQPFGAPAGGGYPPPASPQVRPRGNVWAALGLSLLAALLATYLYALLFSGMFDEETGEFTQIGYVALAIGAAVGAGPAFLAKRNWAACLVAAVLALAATVFGEVYGTAMVISEYGYGSALSANDIFLDHFGDLFNDWWESSEPMNYLFLLFAPLGTVGLCRSVAKRGG